MKKIPVVFSGYNQRAVIAFLRTLETRGLKYAIVASSSDDSIFLTSYAKNVITTRKQKALDLADMLDSLNEVRTALAADKYLIAPSTEALNRFLLEHRNDFIDAACEIPIVDKALYENISDKHSFSAVCRSAGINVPAEFRPGTEEYPYVAKPKHYFSSDGSTHPPIIIKDEKDQKRFVGNYDSDDFYYQAYIGGSSFYLLYYVYSDGQIVKLSQKNLAQQPAGKSIIAAETSDIHNTKESEAYEKLLRSLNFHGLIMVEVKSRGDRHYMVEANPRFWGPSQLFVDAGINLFDDFLSDAGLTSSRPEHGQPSYSRYFWEGGLRQAYKEGGADYHDYTEYELNRDMSDWRASDIYNREDTVKLYEQEMRAL